MFLGKGSLSPVYGAAGGCGGSAEALHNGSYGRYLALQTPNNTLRQANHLGKLSAGQQIHIFGHVNGTSDPYDYFDYTVTEPGNINVKMYEGGAVVYEDNFAAPQAGSSFHYYAWATGNANVDYSTYITLSHGSVKQLGTNGGAG